MLSTHRSNPNNSDIKGGETLFEFLKRKKKFALEVSLSKSRKQNARKCVQSCSPQKPDNTVRFNSTLDLESNIKCNTHRGKNKECTTPKKNSSANPRKKNRHTSFIEMISPLRRHQQRSLTPENHRYHENKPRQNNQQGLKNKRRVEEIFHRKNLNKSITVMKETLLKFMSEGKTVKEKAHTLFVELKPILKFVEEGPNRNFALRAEQVRLKIRTFEHLFKEFNVENGQQIIENMHRNLSEHIISLEGKIRLQFQKNDLTALNKIKEAKDKKIEQLSQELVSIQKELEITRRKLQKSERENHKLSEEFHTSTLSKTTKLSAHQASYQEKISQYEGQLEYFAKQLDHSKQKQKELEKKVKDAVYLKQEAQKRFIKESTRIKSTKEDYLLNEIQMLKKEFKSDMRQMATLQKDKQVDYVQLIDQLKKQKVELVASIETFKEKEKKVKDQMINNRMNLEKYMAQNQCLVTDMNRMNEELYQHWLALKDIKTLAVRLQIFPKFQRIYKDLVFNDQLFV